MSIFKLQWTEKRIRLWLANQALGKSRWVLTHGVMGWGTSMFLFTTAISVISGEPEDHLRSRLIVGMVLWPIAGLLWGLSVWSLNERSYQKHLEAAASLE